MLAESHTANTHALCLIARLLRSPLAEERALGELFKAAYEQANQSTTDSALMALGRVVHRVGRALCGAVKLDTQGPQPMSELEQ